MVPKKIIELKGSKNTKVLNNSSHKGRREEK